VADTKYAQNYGVHIAYRVVGNGPIDIVLVCGTMSHLDLWFSDRLASSMVHGLASFARVILFDKPGTGLSDPVPGAPTLDQRVDDILAVLDAVGSEKAVLVGYSEGGIPSIALAATRPERVHSLVLLHSLDHLDPRPDDLPQDVADLERLWGHLDRAKENWGDGGFIRAFSPTYAQREEFNAIASTNEVRCMSPGMARAIFSSYHALDVTDLCAHVRVPSIVLQSDDNVISMGLGRSMARRLGSQFEALEGRDHFPWIHNHDRIVSRIEEFVTGHRSPIAPTRGLATIVFSDIVDSTLRNAQSGDQRWHQVRSGHDELTRQLAESFGGRAVKSTGDGWLAIFNRTGKAVRYGLSLAHAVHDLDLQLRVGIHTGECDDVGTDVHGLAVHIAARVNSLAEPDEVLVSATVKDLLAGSGLEFQDRGEHVLKGAPDLWQLHAVVGDRALVTAGGYEVDVRELV
jgi:pimeloyl-ACP methyl ester carboxylesterase/class 3 adenylate cyclase